MITVTTNLSAELTHLAQRLQQATAADEVTRVVASGLVPEVRDRIHNRGLAADGSAIGIYSEGYMHVRTGVFKSNGEYKSGKRKGQTRDSGDFVRGVRKGQPRPKYNRTDDRKVVLSLTRQMENDLSVQHGDNSFGIGFSNPENALKAQYCEKTYRKVIYSLTAEEEQLAIVVAENHVKKFLS